ncbi:MAG: hypothetical protein Kow0075_16190 [Salibacteraceae bacterium]
MNYNNKRRSRTTRKRSVSRINPDLLVKKAKSVAAEPYVAKRNFDGFELHEKLKRNITEKGYKLPTEIQDKCIDELIRGKDLIGIAATGTGKTGAFLIPMIHQMLTGGNASALVVVPTRELAQQVQSEFKSLTRGTGFTSACFIGGTSVGKDLSIARKRLNLIVGTPGRLNDLIDRRALKISHIPILVLDEFDRMLDMGFIRDIQKLIQGMHDRRQTMLFSATLDSSQEKLISEITSSAMRVNVTGGIRSSDNVEQRVIRVKGDENKFDVLVNLVNQPSFDKVLLFVETKRGVDKLSKKLKQSGIRTDVIHGDKSQSYRSRAIEMFKSGRTKVLVATDVAARGIDIKGITHVINYQLPQTMDSYIHRIGRTGRAASTGMAYTFIN